ncbi:MAG: YcnI family protein [Mycobacteriales bacterium]
MVRPLRSAAIVAAGTAGLLALTALPASAHVTVNPGTAVQGGFTALTFRVPTEKDNASTTAVQVFLPTGTPIPSVSVRPVPGWTAKVNTTHLARPVQSDDGPVSDVISDITWTANSAADAIAPAQFQEFEISAGPLPKVRQLVFKTLQTYSDSSVARWIDLPQGPTEPEHPAPVLKLTAAGEDDAATGGAATTATGSGTSTGTKVVAGAGLAAGLLALLVAGYAVLTTRRRAPG